MIQISNQIILITGPNSVGKGTIAHNIVADPRYNAANVIRYTTRQIGKDEVNGETYHFVDNDTFEAMIAEGQFAEFHKFFPGYYGTTIASCAELLAEGVSPVIDLDTLAAGELKERFDSLGIPVVGLFISPVSREILRQEAGMDIAIATIRERIIARARGFDLDEAVIEHRTNHARVCLTENVNNPYLIENITGNVEWAMNQVENRINIFRLERFEGTELKTETQEAWANKQILYFCL